MNLSLKLGTTVNWVPFKKGPCSGICALRTALATPVTPELEAPFALDAPKSTRLFPVHGDSVPRRLPVHAHAGLFMVVGPRTIDGRVFSLIFQPAGGGVWGGG